MISCDKGCHGESASQKKCDLDARVFGNVRMLAFKTFIIVFRNYG